MPEIPEDLTTEEQLRRCREMLAANLCTQGVRALPDEPLTQLIAKVGKIDRQQRHIDTLWNYANTLKNFAIANQQDYFVIGSTDAIRCNSNTSRDANNLTVAYVYWSVPTSFPFNGTTYNVSPANVVLLSCVYMDVVWGGNANNAIRHYYSYSKRANTTPSTKFDSLKAQLDNTTTYSVRAYGTTSLNKGEVISGYFDRNDANQYLLRTYPYSTSYDYWYGYDNCFIHYPLWAVKLPNLGTSPNVPFPDPPIILDHEFYY
ncbi:MAG: hypothetical protein LBP87_03245 [Planctomycetaceae bacterium]|jgi:hypothetical protein|nr:hypothetical protein [Planctomycetaceae bacterium]